MAISVGYNYGKSPIGTEDVNANLGSTAIVEHHLSFGITRKFSDKVSGSFAYTHAFNNKVVSSTGDEHHRDRAEPVQHEHFVQVLNRDTRPHGRDLGISRLIEAVLN